MKIQVKRIYEEALPTDGTRILVDRLWPRGMAKERAQIHFWAKTISPSNELRSWYSHTPSKWKEFERRYTAELNDNPDGLSELKQHLDSDTVTFVFSSKETELNNATALKQYLENQT